MVRFGVKVYGLRGVGHGLGLFGEPKALGAHIQRPEY